MQQNPNPNPMVFFRQNNPQENLYNRQRKKERKNKHLLKYGFFYKQINPQESLNSTK